jgi:hypothetical protein
VKEMFWLFHAENLENIFEENALKPLIANNCLIADKSTFVTTIRSSEDFDTLLDKLSALLRHSPTASQQRKFPIN